LPFTLATGLSSQEMSWSSPPWSHDSMSCLMRNELLHHMCELCNISEPSSLSWQVLLTHMYLWTNYLCISLKHILIHLKLSLNYQNQTRTFHLPTSEVTQWHEQFTRAILRCFAGKGARPLTITGAGHEQSPTHAEAPPLLQAI
jgi:hypothetical protein